MVAAVAAAIMLQPEISAAISSLAGATAGSGTLMAAAGVGAGALGAGVGNVALSAAITGLVTSSLSQAIATGKINMGSALKMGAIAGLTAGLLNGITYTADAGLGFTTTASKDSLAALAGVQASAGSGVVPTASSTVANLPTQALAIAGQATIQAGVQTAIGGGSFLTNLRNSAVTAVAAAGAFEIGQAQGSLSELQYVAAHAALGCASSAALGTGCAGGAIGGATAALMAPGLNALGLQGPGVGSALGAGLAMLGGGLVAQALGTNGSSAANAAMNADLNNRQLHPDEQAKAQQIAAASGGKYTAQQVGDAMRAASNSQLGENVTTGMVVDGVSNPQGVYDTGATFSVPSGDGRTLVQSVPTHVDSELAAYIRSMTGGSSSPYSWDAATLGTATTSTPGIPVNPFTPAQNGCITAECAAGLGQQGRGLLPDYATTSIGSLSGNLTGAMSLYDGSTYVSGGVVQANPSSISYKPGLSGTVGYIFGANDAAATRGFLAGDGNQVFVSIPTPFDVNAMMAITHAYGGSTALEFGLGTPGPITFGVLPWGHSTQASGNTK